MKKLVTTLFLAAASLAAAFAGEPLFLADPYVVYSDGVYYAYGTGHRNGIAVYRSTDLKHWEGPCGKAEEGLALHKGDTWGESKFWAPEVYPVGDHYLMTYSADEHIVWAEGASPMGPFTQKEPFTSYLTERGIDSHIFVDSDGKAYIFWVRFDEGNHIWEARLSSDLKTIASEPEHCITVQPGTWESADPAWPYRVAEGPFVVKHGDYYYLTYSCNHFQSPEYAVGYATSKSPAGPWTRYEGNPILHRYQGYRGTGHHSFFTGAGGQMYIVFHAHHDDTKANPRRTLIAPCSFRETGCGPAVLEISPEVIVPELEVR